MSSDSQLLIMGRKLRSGRRAEKSTAAVVLVSDMFVFGIRTIKKELPFLSVFSSFSGCALHFLCMWMIRLGLFGWDSTRNS